METIDYPLIEHNIGDVEKYMNNDVITELITRIDSLIGDIEYPFALYFDDSDEDEYAEVDSVVFEITDNEITLYYSGTLYKKQLTYSWTDQYGEIEQDADAENIGTVDTDEIVIIPVKESMEMALYKAINVVNSIVQKSIDGQPVNREILVDMIRK